MTLTGLAADFQVMASPLGYVPNVFTGIQTLAATAITDGMTFSLTDAAGTTATFEFDSNGSFTPGNIPVPYLHRQCRHAGHRNRGGNQFGKRHDGLEYHRVCRREPTHADGSWVGLTGPVVTF